MLVFARCWGYSGKHSRPTVPSLMEPTVQKALNNYYKGHVCNDRQPPDTGTGIQQGESIRLRDHGQGTHFLITLHSTLSLEVKIMYVKSTAPCLVHDGTVTAQTSYGLLLGELSSEPVSSSIGGHFFFLA